MQEQPISKDAAGASPGKTHDLTPLDEATNIAFEADAIVNLIARCLWRTSEDTNVVTDDITVCARALEGVSRLVVQSVELIDDSHRKLERQVGLARGERWVR